MQDNILAEFISESETEVAISKEDVHFLLVGQQGGHAFKDGEYGLQL